MSKIKRKFIMVFVLLVSLGVVISGLLSIGLLKSNYEENIKENLIENATIIKHLIEKELEEDKVNTFINDLKSLIDTRMTLIDGNGDVVVDSEVDVSLLDNHGDRPEVKLALKGETGNSKRFSTSVDKEMYYIALPVESANVKVVRLSIPLKTLTEYTDKIVGNILIAAIAGVLLATMLGIRFLNMFTGPLGELTEATKNISRGNFGERVYISSDDEIGQLADSFNTMSYELDKRMEELKESNITNYAILKSMINGVIAIDNDSNIMFINKAAQNMFNVKEKELKTQKIQEAFEGHELSVIFGKDFDFYGDFKSEFVVYEPHYKVYRVFSNIIKDKNHTMNNMGLLLNFVDITQMRQLENMRKDFVANVSHELKTPLTSIQGFIETLKEGAAEQKVVRDKFIDIIDIEANRLKHLIDDILVLSDIEKTSTDQQFTAVDLHEAIDEIKDMMQQIAEKKNTRIHYSMPEKLSTIKGNKVQFKQMMINLIDNAIKYTPDQGQVNIVVDETPLSFNISVEDNGIGIANEHLDRLFERFYRVDKARSKKVGGTGLGLAIVKHIVLSMNGVITVESQVEQGTIFKINIPKS